MQRYSEATLWAFVGRADTEERIDTATAFLRRLSYLEGDTLECMVSELRHKKSEMTRRNNSTETDFSDCEQLTLD